MDEKQLKISSFKNRLNELENETSKSKEEQKKEKELIKELKGNNRKILFLLFFVFYFISVWINIKIEIDLEKELNDLKLKTKSLEDDISKLQNQITDAGGAILKQARENVEKIQREVNLFYFLLFIFIYFYNNFLIFLF